MGECGWVIIAHVRVGYSVYTTATTSTNNSIILFFNGLIEGAIMGQ
jgi:hypothetical protein